VFWGVSPRRPETRHSGDAPHRRQAEEGLRRQRETFPGDIAKLAGGLEEERRCWSGAETVGTPTDNWQRQPWLQRIIACKGGGDFERLKKVPDAHVSRSHAGHVSSLSSRPGVQQTVAVASASLAASSRASLRKYQVPAATAAQVPRTALCVDATWARVPRHARHVHGATEHLHPPNKAKGHSHVCTTQAGLARLLPVL